MDEKNDIETFDNIDDDDNVDKESELIDDLSSLHDKTIQFFFDRHETAESFFREYLPQNITKNLDFNSLEICKDKFVSKKMSRYFSDILYHIRLKGMDAFIYMLIEHKSQPEYFIGLQFLKYMVRIWELYLKQDEEARTLPVILPILIYNGPTKWRVKTRFIHLFDAPGEVKDYIPDFKYNLHDISHLPDEKIRGDILLRILFLTFKYISKPALIDKLPEIFRLFFELSDKSSASEYLEVLLRYLSGSARHLAEDELMETVTKTFEKGGDLMAVIADKWVREGVEIGKKEGKDETTWFVVKNSLKEGLPLETIRTITGLPLEEISQIKEKLASGRMSR